MAQDLHLVAAEQAAQGHLSLASRFAVPVPHSWEQKKQHVVALLASLVSVWEVRYLLQMLVLEQH